MNKHWLSLLLLATSCSCFSSCSKDKLPDPPFPPPAVLPDGGVSDADEEDGSFSYYNSEFSFILPSLKWRTDPNKIGTTKAFFVNVEQQASWLASSESFNATQDAFALLTIRAIKESGMSVLHTENSIMINNHKFYGILASKESSFFRLWLLVNQGKAFTFGCKVEESTQQNTEVICSEIANTIEVK